MKSEINLRHWSLLLLLMLAILVVSKNCSAIEPQKQESAELSDEQKGQLTEARKLEQQSRDLYLKKEFAAAAELASRMLFLDAQVLGLEHPGVAVSMYNVAINYEQAGQVDAAQSLLKRALAINEKHPGAERLGEMKCLDALAGLHESRGNYASALPFRHRVSEIQEQLHGSEHPATARSLNKEAQILDNLGRLAAARGLYERALAIAEKSPNGDPSELATYINNLAYVLRKQGHDAAALPLYRRALEINEKHLDADNPSIALSLNNLASLYEAQGNIPTALSLHQRALAIRQKSSGPNHPDTAQSLNNLAVLYSNQNDHDTAMQLNLQALTIREQALGPEHPLTAASLNNLAHSYLSLGNDTLAEPLFQRAIDLLGKNLGADHPEVAVVHGSLALLYSHQQNYEAARTHLNHALFILLKALGSAHPTTFTVLERAAFVEAQTGNRDAASQLIDRARRGTRTYVRQVLPGLSEKEQLLFLAEKYQTGFQNALRLGVAFPDDAEVVRLSATWLMNGKAVADEALAAQHLLARDAADATRSPLAERLMRVRAELAAIAMKIVEPKSAAARKDRMEALTSEKEKLVRELSALGGGTGDSAVEWVDFEQIRNSLPNDITFIDLARVVLRETSTDRDDATADDANYFAWVTVFSGSGQVSGTTLIDLGPASEVEEALRTVRQMIGEASGESGEIALEGHEAATESFNAAMQALAERIWKPLAPHIQDHSELVISPDGELWLAPWSAIPVGREAPEYLIEMHQIRFVTSGRDLVSTAAQKHSGQSVIVANPLFDDAPRREQSTRLQSEESLTTDEDSSRSTTVGSRLPEVAALPYTELEARTIQPKIDIYTHEKSTLYLRHEADESVVRTLQRPRIAVFATHGFFLPQVSPFSSTSPRAAGVDAPDDPESAIPPIQNPMLRCGLLLTGCNRRERDAGSDDDGILTGLEIAGIDFRGTELIVLSACETGLGDVIVGEGVAGLRQAFQLAGARSVVSTLWQVPDRDTALLMNRFFEELSAGKSKAEALRTAQLERIRQRRDTFGAAHPYFWAAPTLTGQSSPTGPF
ncbi:MAG: CHAT domain-containing tetratricopeptide repeat protein [Planctomycetaceae bacterium]